MKRSLLFAAIAASSLSFGQFAGAQTTVATDPVGFNAKTVAGGSIESLGVPFNRPAAFTGLVGSRSSNSITVTGAAAGSYGPFTAAGTAGNPHMARMLTGASKGRDFMIDSSADSGGDEVLTITAEGDLTAQIANGDQLQIFPCHTLESLFGADGAGLNNTNSASTADNVQVREAGAWITYFHTAPTANSVGFWAKVGGGSTNFNKKAIFPEQGLLLVRRAGSAYTFTGLGGVPTTNLKTDLPANSVVHLANRFPKDTTLNDLGLHTAAGWKHATSPSSADQVQVRIGGAWQTFFHTSAAGFWAKVGGGSTNFNTQAIPAGAAVLVVRQPGTDVVVDQPLPYTL